MSTATGRNAFYLANGVAPSPFSPSEIGCPIRQSPSHRDRDSSVITAGAWSGGGVLEATDGEVHGHHC